MPLKKPLVLRAGEFSELSSSEAISPELLLSPAARDPRGAVVRSYCDLSNNAASLTSSTCYWVYLGQAQADLLITSVAVYVQAASLGTDTTRIGVAVSSVQPAAAVAQSLTVRSVATINMGSTGRKVATITGVTVTEGQYVWAWLKHAVSGLILINPASVLPLMGAYNGEICSTGSAGNMTVNSVYAASPVPYGTAQAPDLTLTCELTA